MVIFWFLNMAAAAILDFWNLKFQTVATVKRHELRHRAKFRRNRSNRGRDMCFNIIPVWLQNANFCPTPFFGGEGLWHIPPNDVTHRPNQKRTVLGLNHVIWAIKREYRSLRAGRWNEKKGQHRTGKSYKRVIFHQFVEKPALKRRTWKFVQ